MNPFVRGALAIPLFACLAAGSASASDTAIPPGGTAAADVAALRSYAPTDNPGRTDFDGEADAWLGLFTADAVFVAGIPGQTEISFTGDGFRAFWTERMKEFRTSGNLRRHLMSNVLFLDQTADTAHVSVVGLLTNANDGKTFSAVSSLNYEGWLTKGPDGWKIERWHDFPDAAFQE